MPGWYANTYAWRTLVIAYSKTGKSAEARRVLGEWESALDERRKLVEEIRKKRAAGQPADSRPLSGELDNVEPLERRVAILRIARPARAR